MATSRQLDVLLVNPGSRMQVYQSLGKRLSAIEPPVWAGLMASFLRGHGRSVEILDGEADDLAPTEIADRTAGLSPRLVAVIVYGHQPSGSTQNMPQAGAICAAIRERAPGARTILVGGHVAALPRRTLEEESVDFVSGGEGLVTLLELIRALETGGRDLDRVRGLWYRAEGEIVGNQAAPLVTDLDRAIPGVAWDLLPMERYRAHTWHCFGHGSRHPYAAIYTTLGCPFKCSFCCIQAPFRDGEYVAGQRSGTNSYRFWSPDAVLAQIDTLVRDHGVRHIKFADEMFVLNRAHVLGICDRIIDRGHDLNIWAYARVDTLRDDELLGKLKAAGFNWLCLGIEAASGRVRNDVDKAYRQDLIFESVRRAREAGIHIIANFIFGLPEDDLASMQATLELALDLNCEFANFYCAMAYPGAPLYDLAMREGWQLPAGWAGYSQHSVDTLPLPTRHLPASEVLRFRDEAFHTYFENPAYLDLVRTKFGPETEAHIRGMTTKRLQRLHVRARPGYGSPTLKRARVSGASPGKPASDPGT